MENQLGLITDRKKSDVERIIYLALLGWENMTSDEQSEFMLSSKGAYNATDLNRVGNAVSVIAQKLTNAGNAITVNVKTDWTMSENPTSEQMEEYLANISAIRAVLSVMRSTPFAPTQIKKMNIQKANDIEQILLDVDSLIDKMSVSYYYSNELYGGER